MPPAAKIDASTPTPPSSTTSAASERNGVAVGRAMTAQSAKIRENPTHTRPLGLAFLMRSTPKLRTRATDRCLCNVAIGRCVGAWSWHEPSLKSSTRHPLSAPRCPLATLLDSGPIHRHSSDLRAVAWSGGAPSAAALRSRTAGAPSSARSGAMPASRRGRPAP